MVHYLQKRYFTSFIGGAFSVCSELTLRAECSSGNAACHASHAFSLESSAGTACVCGIFMSDLIFGCGEIFQLCG